MTNHPDYRAYAGAKFGDEPTEADYIGSFGSPEDAKAAVRNARKGGHGFVWEPRSRQLFADDATSEWTDRGVQQ